MSFAHKYADTPSPLGAACRTLAYSTLVRGVMLASSFVRPDDHMQREFLALTATPSACEGT